MTRTNLVKTRYLENEEDGHLIELKVARANPLVRLHCGLLFVMGGQSLNSLMESTLEILDLRAYHHTNHRAVRL